MTITFKQEKEDLYAFNLYNSWSAPERRNHRLKSYLLLPGLMLAFLIFKTMHVSPEIRLAFVINLGISMLVVCLIYAFLLEGMVTRKIKKNVNRLLQTSRNEELLGDKEFSLSDAGISAKGVHSTSELNWSSIERFRHTDDYYFLYLNAFGAVVIPKSAIQDTVAFEALVKSKVQLT